MTEKTKGASLLYAAAALFIAGVYVFVPLFFIVNRGAAETGYDPDTGSQVSSLPLLLPILLGALNLTAVIALRNRCTREQLLNCALAIKYALIPFYVMGALVIGICLLMMFTPVVIMVFIGPTVAVVFSVFGWIIMVCGAPFSIGYLVKAKREGIHHRALCKIAGICQFFFTADVISMMVLAFKERKWIKITVFLLLILLLGITAVTVWLGIKIIGALL